MCPRGRLTWARTHDHECIAALGEQYARATMVNTALVLLSPTGERNTMSFAPRGAVLCAAAGVSALLNQLAAVFATGNTAYVTARWCRSSKRLQKRRYRCGDWWRNGRCASIRRQPG
jgi:delta 1-pyrroline-5-carboxylate dehydrogenase